MTGRDEARAHPPVDELADLREGLLSQADEARVREHVDGCSACAVELAALDEVAAMLRETGAEPIAMPAAVARAIDDALSHAAATPSALPLPERVAAVPARSRRRWAKPAFGWLAGAAAAVVVIGGIGVGLGNIGSNSDDNASGAADSSGGQGAEVEGPTSSPAREGNTSGQHRELRHLDKETIRSYAMDLAATTPAPSGDHTSGSGGDDTFGRKCSAPQGMGGLKEPVIWYGDDALLVVRREPRVASVYSCDATPRRLYSAPY
jgi:putative zinc finger protein